MRRYACPQIQLAITQVYKNALRTIAAVPGIVTTKCAITMRECALVEATTTATAQGGAHVIQPKITVRQEATATTTCVAKARSFAAIYLMEIVTILNVTNVTCVTVVLLKLTNRIRCAV
jgi:hypothetical protein